MSLAAKLPYTHAYAGGYPSLGSQPLPTDSDCLTYLAAVAAADGAGVEVGVATAVDEFFRDLKATPGLFDAIKASCILCGARTLSGALVPMKGDAPSNANFIAADYSRTGGLTGTNGANKYLNANRAANADPQDNHHISVHAATFASGTVRALCGYSAGRIFNNSVTSYSVQSRTTSGHTTSFPPSDGLIGLSRSNSAEYVVRRGTASDTVSAVSDSTGISSDQFIFGWAAVGSYFGSIRFYSIGEAVDLAALDDAVSTLVTNIGAAI